MCTSPIADLDASVAFYRALFATEPTVLKPDYAKWMLDDRRHQLRHIDRGHHIGLDHLGIQVETDEELGELRHRLDAAALAVAQEQALPARHARSNKHWTVDPQRHRVGNPSAAWTQSRCSATTTCPSSSETKAAACCPLSRP
ncbi:MAG: glyoxalase/bleomycin resistance/dioxygenase family protein [Burkholderiales bacterium]